MNDKISIKLLPISLERVSNYQSWFNDKEVRQYLDFKTPKTKTEIINWLKKITTSEKYCYFSIFLPKQNQFIGHVGLKNINLIKKTAEIGIVIGEKKYWRKGIGTKTVLKIIKKAKKLGLKKIIAEINKNNIASQNLFSKLGFKKLATKQRDSLRFVLDL